jgi:hypothetical protein
MNQRVLCVQGEANLRKQVKAPDSSDAGRHQNTNAQKALMEYLLLGKVENT